MNKHELRDALAGLALLDTAMPLSAVQALVWTSLNDGSHQNALENYLGTSNATASRAVAYWSEWKSFKDNKRGHGFIESYPDPMDKRFRVLRMTPAGKAFLNRLLGGTNGSSTRE